MIIYKITNKINGKIYIGQTTQSLRDRKNNHVADSKRNRKGRVASKISRAIQKYGITNFLFEEICTTNSIDELNNLECYYIGIYNSTNDKIGYNLLNGGHQNGRHSEESKIKMSISSKKVADSVKGNHWNAGRIPTPEKTKKASYKLQSEDNPNAVAVIQLDKNGSFIKRHYSQAEAARSIGIDNSGNICLCCSGSLKTAYGFKWMYEENYNN
jgi:group I intron endonuclease